MSSTNMEGDELMEEAKTTNATSSTFDYIHMIFQPYMDTALQSRTWQLKSANRNITRSINTCMELCLESQKNAMHLGFAVAACVEKTWSACRRGVLHAQDISKTFENCMESSNQWMKSCNEYLDGQADVVRQYIGTLKGPDAAAVKQRFL